MNPILSVKTRLSTAYFRCRSVDQYTRIRIVPWPDLKRLGDDGCAWVVPVGSLPKGAVCYCVGAGENISFDLALARDLQCEVHTFDPTPRAIAHVTALKAELPFRFSFHPIGVWMRDERVRFYAPKYPNHVSHSIVNLQRTDEFFEGECKRLRTIMNELGHRSLDLVKLDIEGAEHDVIESMIADGISPTVLAVEFDEIHHPLDGGAPSRIKAVVEKLINVGYSLVSVDGPNYTFVIGPAGCG